MSRALVFVGVDSVVGSLLIAAANNFQAYRFGELVTLGIESVEGYFTVTGSVPSYFCECHSLVALAADPHSQMVDWIRKLNRILGSCV